MPRYTFQWSELPSYRRLSSDQLRYMSIIWVDALEVKQLSTMERLHELWMADGEGRLPRFAMLNLINQFPSSGKGSPL